MRERQARPLDADLGHDRARGTNPNSNPNPNPNPNRNPNRNPNPNPIPNQALKDGVDLRETISRARFEELCLDLFKKTMAPVTQVLRP